LFFEVLSSNLVQRTGWHPGAGNAQILGLGKDLLALDSKFLGYVVNPNGHNVVLAFAMATESSCVEHGDIKGVESHDGFSRGLGFWVAATYLSLDGLKESGGVLAYAGDFSQITNLRSGEVVQAQESMVY